MDTWIESYLMLLYHLRRLFSFELYERIYLIFLARLIHRSYDGAVRTSETSVYFSETTRRFSQNVLIYSLVKI
jgi:hypothetical protein